MNCDNKSFFIELLKQESGGYKFKFTEVNPSPGEQRKVYWSQEFPYFFMNSPEFNNIRDFAMRILVNQGISMYVNICNDYVISVDGINMYIKIYNIPDYYQNKRVINNEIIEKLFNGHEDIAQTMVNDIKIQERLFIIYYLYGHKRNVLYESIVMFLMLRLDKEGVANPLNECNLIHNDDEGSLNASRSYGCTPYLYYMACKMLHIYRYEDENDFVYELPCYPGMIYAIEKRLTIGDIRLKLEEPLSLFPDFITKMLLLQKEKQSNYA